MKVSLLEIVIILSIVIVALSIVVKNKKENLCDSSLGAAPLGMPYTWTRLANPFLNGMYS